MDYGLWSMDYGLWTMDYGLWTMDYGLNNKTKYIEVKLTKNSILSTILFIFLVATLMALEEFYEGELSGEGAIEEVLAYLSILVIIFVFIATPFSFAVNKWNETMPWKENFLKRISIEGLLVLVLSAGLGCIFGYFIHLYIDHVLPQIAVNMRTILFLLITSSLILGLIELRFISDERHELLHLSQKLEKENVESLYNSLKNQVNPHFLFNSLSVLSSLIYVDTDKADEFIQHFSKIYRYALELNDEKLVSLEKELEFIDSYIFLQKIRFGNNLTINFKIDAKEKEMFIPPMSLQLLVENVVKHNVVSKERPMTIHIESSENQEIVVINKLMPKENYNVHSTGIGLDNIQKRYKYLGGKMPSFQIDDKFYVAKLPLLAAS